MGNKFSSGPWIGTSTVGSDGDICMFIIESKDRYIADVHVHNTGDEKEAKANANLIAAAPELLLACEGALNALRLAPHVDKQQAIDYLIEVIKKAKGE